MVEKIILGTVQLGIRYGINNTNGLMSDSEASQILELAAKEGILILDTAADYGCSERRIGLYNNGDNKFKIITKFTKKEGINWKESLKKSLEYLQIEQLDTIMFHSYDSYMEFKPILRDIIIEGKNKFFNHIGVSVYTNDELSQLYKDELIEVIQCPFNMLDNQLQRGKYLADLKASGKIIHTRSVFLQGLFFMESKSFPVKLSPLAKYCSKIHSIAVENKLSIGHLALQYVLSKNYIDGVLLGVDSVEQLKTNIQWTKTHISPSILSQIDKIKVIETALLNPTKW